MRRKRTADMEEIRVDFLDRYRDEVAENQRRFLRKMNGEPDEVVFVPSDLR